MLTNTKTRILFVCVGNMIRSQIAEGFAREFGGTFLEVYSAGLRPTGSVSEEAIAVMKEKGIDISGQYSKGLEDVPLREMGYVVSMSGHPGRSFCPSNFSGTIVDWDIEDPLGHAIPFFREARDEIEALVKEFVQRIWKDARKQKTR
jgi:arsenate reductase